jgi:hypothetical protein
MKKLLVFIGCLALISLVNCNKDKYTLTLVLNNTSGVSGDTAYTKLVTPGGNENSTAEYSGSSIFVSNYATIIIEDIEDATYTLYTFIDEDGNCNVSDPKPDSGDPFNSQTIIMEDDVNLPISSWANY